MVKYHPIFGVIMSFTKDNTVGFETRFGDQWKGVRCGAKTRSGSMCQRPAFKRNGKCRLHGGASTGPRTKDGIARIKAANTTHGRTTKEKLALAKQNAQYGRECWAELLELERWFVDHGHLDKDWREDWDKL
jgi:hypothetical protein